MKKVALIIIAIIIIAGGAVYYFVAKNHAGTTGVSYTNNANPTPAANTMTSPKESEQAAETPQMTDKVSIAGMAFTPAHISVKKGTTVTWTNQDNVAHTVTESDGQNGPKSGNLEKGQTYTFTFDTAGTYKYHCSIHPNMTGTVSVTE